jgi:hypothetical protein
LNYLMRMMLIMMSDTSLTNSISPLQGLMVSCFQRWTMSNAKILSAYSAKIHETSRPKRARYFNTGQRPVYQHRQTPALKGQDTLTQDNVLFISTERYFNTGQRPVYQHRQTPALKGQDTLTQNNVLFISTERYFNAGQRPVYQHRQTPALKGQDTLTQDNVLCTCVIP